MGNAWDIPYAEKFKVGDSDEDAIFKAVGKALSKWEGLVADLTSVFAVLTATDEPWTFKPAVRAFGSVQGAATKSEMLQQGAEALFHNFERQLNVDCTSMREELKGLLREYTGWGARRNDIAHGYVTESRAPDYTKDEQPIVSTFLLFPSHNGSRKWPMDWELTYKYRKGGIDKFDVSFADLPARLRLV